MTIRLRRLSVLLLPLALCQVSLRAQVSPRWSACRGDTLSTYNCASYYSGTVSLTSEIKTASDTVTSSIVATITAGRVTCRIKNSETGDFEGTGMVAAQHEGTGDSGEYTIKVWCPESEGERLTRIDAPVLDTYKQRTADYTTLEGKDVHEHPDADPANGVTGTETLTWVLRRT